MGDMTVDELKDKKLWFLWSAKPGRNGKVTKVPFAANGGATGTDDAHKGTWVSFDDAESARNQFRASGLGLKIPKGFFLLDIDHKNISDPFAQLMLSRFSAYAEVSPSGKGIHIIGQCDITKLPVHFDDRRKKLGWTVNIIRNVLILDWNFISVILQTDMALLQEIRLTVCQ